MKKNHDKKPENEVIVFNGATGSITLTQADFESKEAFEYWRNWLTENRPFPARLGHTSLWETMDYLPGLSDDESETCTSVPSSSEIFLLAKRSTSVIQYRRLMMYEMQGMSLEEIAIVEGVTFQAVSKSIIAAKKRIIKTWRRKHRE